MSSPRYDEVEAAVFVRWVNHCLEEQELCIEDLESGFTDGIALTRLVEAISGVALGKINTHPKLGVQRMDNISKCFEALATHFGIVAPVGLSVQDMAHGKPNAPLLMDLLWDLVARFQVSPALEHVGATAGPPYKEKAIAWLAPISKLVKVTSLASGMQDGRALCAMVYRVDSSLLDYHSMKKSDALQNFQSALLLLEVEFGMWVPILPEEGARASDRCFCLLLSYCMQRFGDLSNPKPIKAGAAAKPSSVLARARTEGRMQTGSSKATAKPQGDEASKGRSLSEKSLAGSGKFLEPPNKGKESKPKAPAAAAKSQSAEELVEKTTKERDRHSKTRARKSKSSPRESGKSESTLSNSSDVDGEADPNKQGESEETTAGAIGGESLYEKEPETACLVALEVDSDLEKGKEVEEKNGEDNVSRNESQKKKRKQKPKKASLDALSENVPPVPTEPKAGDSPSKAAEGSAEDVDGSEAEAPAASDTEQGDVDDASGPSKRLELSASGTQSEPVLRRNLSKKEKKKEKKRKREARRSARMAAGKGFPVKEGSERAPAEGAVVVDDVVSGAEDGQSNEKKKKGKKKRKGSEPLTAASSVLAGSFSPRKSRKSKTKSQGHEPQADGVVLRGSEKKPRIKGTASMMVSPTLSHSLDEQLTSREDALHSAIAEKQEAEKKLARLSAEVMRANAQTTQLVSNLMAEIELLKSAKGKPTKEDKKMAKNKTRGRSTSVAQTAAQFPPLQQPHSSALTVIEQQLDEKKHKRIDPKKEAKLEKAEKLEKSTSDSEMKKNRGKKTSSLGRATGKVHAQTTRVDSSDLPDLSNLDKPQFGRTTSTYEPLCKESDNETKKEKGVVRIMLHDGTYRTIPVSKSTTVAETKEVLIQRLAKKSESLKGRAVIEADLRSAYFIVQETLLEGTDCLLEIAKKNDTRQTRLVFREPNAQPHVVIEEKVLPAELETVTRGTDTIVSILANRVQTLEQEADGLRAQLERLKVKSKGKRKLAVDTVRVDVNERLAEIGGSFARVCGATVDGWGCALKELNLIECEDPQLFEQEIAVLEYLPYHPNIVRYLFHERSDTTLQLFMTRYNGTLGNYLGRRKTKAAGYFTPADIQKYLLDISSGLSFLHNHGIMHRDLKSDNVFVTVNESSGILRLAIGDFDTAKFMKRSGRPRTVIGTPSFIAPEVLTAKQTGGYDYKADVYSLGMVIFEILTLMAPYELEKCTVLEISKNTQDGVRPKLPDDLDEAYKPIIDLHRLCTEPDPVNRPDASKVLDLVKEMPFVANPNAQIFIEYA